jgi:proline racemase
LWPVSSAAAAEIATIDYHTAGEPFRIVVGGAPELPGDSVRDRRERARVSESVDAVRRLLCHEPRGHADMYGCFLVPPDAPGAELGALFWHKDGFSSACGHGTIALGAWAVESGRVDAAPDGDTELAIDVPSGRVAARVRCEGGRVAGVTFRNVPAYVLARALPLELELGAGSKRASVAVDMAYGGAIYASLPAAALGLRVAAERLPELIAAGRAVKAALEGTDAARHPVDERLAGVYGTILYEELEGHGRLRQRNVTVFADGQVDRSPCGSGSSARAALLHADGRLAAGEMLVHESIVETEFEVRVVAESVEEGRPAVVTDVSGTAYRTGEHRFVLDPRDPLGTGFVLR